MVYQVRYTTKEMYYYHNFHTLEMAMEVGRRVCQMEEAINVAVVGNTIKMLKKDGKIL